MHEFCKKSSIERVPNGAGPSPLTGFHAKSGAITNGSFVEVPKQRNTKEENAQIKSCEVPERIAANPHVLAQKDLGEW